MLAWAAWFVLVFISEKGCDQPTALVAPILAAHNLVLGDA